MIKKTENFPSFGYEDKFLLLGSCFSNHIGERLKYHGFQTEINPLGVVFHPLALATQLSKAMKGDLSGKIFSVGDVYLHSLASSEVYGIGEEAVFANYSKQLSELRNQLLNSTVLIVTFGSMHGYTLVENNEIVANCHKQPAATFNKVFSGIDNVTDIWRELIDDLKAFNPKLEVVFTVSPVRYTRDGILENNHSKARLIEVISRLNKPYFPGYELVNDVLRDYRYFELDQSHPNELAIREVWKMFKEWSFGIEEQKIIDLVLELRTRENHRFLFPDSESTLEFQKITNEKREQLNSLYPYVAL